MVEDLELQALLDAIVSRKGALKFSTNAKIQALERAAVLGIDITDQLREKNREYLQRLLDETPPSTQSLLQRRISRVIGKPSAALFERDRNESQNAFAAEYGEELLARIQQVAGVQKGEPLQEQVDPQKDGAAYLRYWLWESRNRGKFLKHLQAIFPAFDVKQLVNLLSVTVKGKIAHTEEQKEFIQQYGESFLMEILLKFRHFPTDPREWDKGRSRLRREDLFFSKARLQRILVDTGCEHIDPEALRALDRVLLEFGTDVVRGALRLLRHSKPPRKKIQAKDIDLALQLMTGE